MAFFTHAAVAFVGFAFGYYWCFRTWSAWAPKKPKGKP